ncbi:MAG: ribonucleotide reductase subunit alpha [Polaromonas sp.]|uniref:ribonucleotide reductase subunit alpha n=1 Tax=Polaromonas sp. TaxID=1869339 RepID=UPI0027300010|nr:ribonucleotide reductase subunit alpha [Polaromonas sp.]MDP1742375.1 ribonucleotide reductase subunit alpha [Polaromonas sp.]MDP1954688.1 ribonucleotide reductase subunit alpha [Polaromonas sp.]MDP3354301.1 ribonucleotide reductase subunit alpha [Polaromonas sp.]MDP3752322.1 ribonucleotide reductase subunit alpha [Polaromonas sp.]
MDILSFDDLLQAARAQSQPQRLLFVFTGVELPEDSTPVQRTRFEAGQGGALVPLMCVDKRPEELSSFAALVQESSQFGHAWGLVFAAALGGRADRAPTSDDAEEPLLRMVESIKQGNIGAFIPFDAQGQPVQFG